MRALATAAVLALTAVAPVGPPAGKVIDDYPKALVLGREEKAPIFVEAWAPW